ncbi:helix-turn-helix transcriptional regulator [Halobacillus kuroshimensis]|uniref:Helix-turn-helix transcriptional regulator n=1 Tax=Halobacillus kuroshimensis TaxID=302481 RepID=A0ABS3DYL4_9BACI|nr:helix-turn-helix transcriptional regulator [Halobacillus kuroshimensis]MBN8236417.1 helix-turn-helix transcriptional regulator [Halobacillus kuroshimensis]
MDKEYDKEVRAAVGKQIKALRLEKGLSQEEFAFQVGIDRTYVSFIERGVRSPRIPVIYRIAYVLGVSPGELLVEINKTPD